MNKQLNCLAGNTEMARRLQRIVGAREQKARDMQKDHVHCLQKCWKWTQGQVGSMEATDTFTSFFPQLSVFLSPGLATHPAHKHDEGPTRSCCNVLFASLNFTPVF